jgi:lysozyme
MRDPIYEARRYAEWQLQQAYPYREAYFALIGINEPTIDEPDHMKKLADFECERMRILDRHGLRAAILSFAEGNPKNIGWLEWAIPAFQEGRKYDAVYARHSYGWPHLATDAEWRILRHRKEYEGEPSSPHNWPGMPVPLRLPIVITETGLEGMIENSSFPHGWNGHVEADEYLKQLFWLDQELMKDHYVIGATIFCVFDEAGTWALYNINPQPAIDLALLATPVYRRYELPKAVMKLRGIDVSYAQGRRFSWKQVAKNGIKFAFIRSSISLYKDSCFKRNMRNSRRRGIVRGAYHFLRKDTSGTDQARFFYDLIKRKRLELPPVVDVETSPNYGKPTADHVMDFLFEFEKVAQRVPMIYTSIAMWNRITHGRLDEYVRGAGIKLWVADWSDREEPRLPSAWDTWEFWQTTSHGTVANKRVDLDRFNGTTEEFKERYLDA